MKIVGIIKSVQSAIAAGGADITQTLKIEISDSESTDKFKDLRDYMQKPLLITLEAKQLEFGKDSNPMAKGAIET
jgi:hypothetical protein